MLDEGYPIGIGEIVVIIIESHSWLEVIYLFLAIYITIPTKLMDASWCSAGITLVLAKASKWPNDLIAKTFAPFELTLVFLIFSLLPLCYAFFGLMLGFAAEKILQKDNLFDSVQMLFEAALVCAFSFAYCQISLAFKKVGELQSEINQLRYERGLAEAHLSRALEAAEK